MKHITFTHSDEDALSTVTAQGSVIDLFFKSLDVEFIYIDGIEFDANTDTINSIFLSFSKGALEAEIISLPSLIRLAEEQYPDILEEEAIEHRREQRAASYLSSPSLTGRI